MIHVEMPIKTRVRHLFRLWCRYRLPRSYAFNGGLRQDIRRFAALAGLGLALVTCLMIFSAWVNGGETIFVIDTFNEGGVEVALVFIIIPLLVWGNLKNYKKIG